MRHIVVVGAGASGIMAAITAARNGARVTLIEQKNQIGKKILEKCLADTQHQLFLYIFMSNYDAVSLYRRCGFEMAEQVSPTRMIMRCRS